MWPDCFHKINRRVAQALNHPTCSEVKDLLKRAMKLFRFSRAPFSTGRFGQQIHEARCALLDAVKAGKVEELVEMWLGGVAKDRGIQGDTFGKTELVELLQACTRTVAHLAKLFQPDCLVLLPSNSAVAKVLVVVLLNRMRKMFLNQMDLKLFVVGQLCKLHTSNLTNMTGRDCKSIPGV